MYTDVANAFRTSDQFLLQELNFKAQKVLKQFPPARNVNKFHYGGQVQRSSIDYMAKISDVIDYDKGYSSGAHYKNDARFMGVDLSIKACANIGSAITLINKNGKQEHDISDLNVMIIYIREEKIALFPVKIMMPNYINDTGSKIEIIGRAYKDILKNSDYLIEMPPLSEEQKVILETLKEVDVEKELYEKYIL